MKVFFDTTVLIYALAERDARGDIAEHLLASGGSLSVQVLNEFAAVAKEETQDDLGRDHRALDATRVLCEPPLPLTVEVHEAALHIAERYGYHIYAALIVAAALAAGCDVLYSEDIEDGQRIDSLTIRNPFRLSE